MNKTLQLLVVSIITVASPAYGQTPHWQHHLDKQLPQLGHRNWIVVADSAYPSQTAPGIKVISVEGDQLDVIRAVLAAVEKAKHVHGKVFVDSELPYIPEKLAKGIDSYRAGLKKVLKGHQVTSLPHLEIIEKLDKAGQTFHILLLKTDLTLPYTSVFIELECGYWSSEDEKQLRAAMKRAEK